MTLAADPVTPIEPLRRLRGLRATQAGLLAAVSVGSIASGLAMLLLRVGAVPADFVHAVGWQFVIWGAIDLVFASLGIAQSVKVARTPPCPQAEADEFLAAEKLLRSLRFNHKLNVAYLVTAVALLVWAIAVHHAGLAGHGVGVAVQGGFLFVFDAFFAGRLAKLMTTPVL